MNIEVQLVHQLIKIFGKPTTIATKLQSQSKVS